MPIKIVNIVLALAFVAFACFQVNDLDEVIYHRPSVIDAAIWFIFYLLVAIMFIWILKARLPWRLLVVSAIACILEMVITGPGLIENLR
ncbi:MAG: hypothetical protein AAF226_19905, partial [Verrucomicrobiota bacterium]